MSKSGPTITSRWFWLLLLLTVAGENFATAFTLTYPLRWRWSNPTPHGNNVYDMTSHLDLTVQVGDRGQIYASSDLIFWQPLDSGVTNALRAATFLGDRLIITGENGLIRFADSLELIQPATVSPATTDWLEAVTASDTLAVAVGDNSAIYTSSTGTNWTRETVSFPNTPWLTGVAFGNSRYVCVGENGFVARSSSGSSWNPSTSGTTNFLNFVGFFNGRFFAFGDNGTVISSPDGQTWVSHTFVSTNSVFDGAGDGTNTLIVGDPQVRIAPGFPPVFVDEIAATANSNRPPRWTYFSANWLSNQFLIAGHSGMTVQGFNTNAAPNYTWLTHSDPVRNWLWDVLRLPDFYVAIGDFGTLLTSDGGIGWSLELTPAAATNSILLGIAGDTNTIIAVGNKGTILRSERGFTNVVATNVVLAVTNVVTNTINTLGAVWNAVQPPPTTNDLHGITRFGNLWVASGANGTILTSADNGTNWTIRTSGVTSYLSGLATNDTGIVAVGSRGTILTSATATNGWTSIASGTTNWIFRARYLKDTFLAVGENGTLLTSVNRTAWTARNTGVTAWLNDATLLNDADSTYFIVGNQGTVLSATSFSSWQNRGSITGKSLYGVTHNGNGQLLAVGFEGAILRSQTSLITNQPSIITYSRGDTKNAFLLSAFPDQRVSIERSTNLISATNWVPGPSFDVLDPSGTAVSVETINTNQPAQQFYRVRVVP